MTGMTCAEMSGASVSARVTHFDEERTVTLLSFPRLAKSRVDDGS